MQPGFSIKELFKEERLNNPKVKQPEFVNGGVGTKGWVSTTGSIF